LFLSPPGAPAGGLTPPAHGECWRYLHSSYMD